MSTSKSYTFTLADQEAFSEISRDFNVQHLNREQSRRLFFGDVVVHGINTVLRALDLFANEFDGYVNMNFITMEFSKPT